VSDTAVAPTHPLVDGVVEPGCKKVDPIVVADGVTRQFGGLTAVDVQHVEIPRGAITALIGPNGAGKTTFFNLLTGFDKPNTGSWSFEGRDLARVPAFKVARSGMVRTFQLTKSLGRLSVLQNMLLGARKQPGENIFRALVPGTWRGRERDITERAEQLLARFKLDAKKDDYAASLSGGQRKLLEMARALMSEPTLVMLDEPDMHMVRHISDWVIVMAEGRIVAEGPPETVMSDQAVIDAYLGAHHDTDLGDMTRAEAERVHADAAREDVTDGEERP
jgi:neutral amino acid transport system ATP-binding protein